MSEPDRVLVVTAHPDDAEFHFGATIARFVAGGAEVSYLVCTDGVLGGPADGTPDRAVAELRAAEQRAAATVLGVGAVVFLGLRDGALEPRPALRRAIAAHVRRTRPAVVLTLYPRRVLELPIEASHPDHVAVGEATLAALYPDAGNARALPDPPAHQVGEVWIPGYERPNHVVDATPFMDKKLAALRCHRSQVGNDAPAWIHEWMRAAGRDAGYEYAEQFRRIRLG